MIIFGQAALLFTYCFFNYIVYAAISSVSSLGITIYVCWIFFLQVLPIMEDFRHIFSSFRCIIFLNDNIEPFDALGRNVGNLDVYCVVNEKIYKWRPIWPTM